MSLFLDLSASPPESLRICAGLKQASPTDHLNVHEAWNRGELPSGICNILETSSSGSRPIADVCGILSLAEKPGHHWRQRNRGREPHRGQSLVSCVGDGCSPNLLARGIHVDAHLGQQRGHIHTCRHSPLHLPFTQPMTAHDSASHIVGHDITPLRRDIPPLKCEHSMCCHWLQGLFSFPLAPCVLVQKS